MQPVYEDKFGFLQTEISKRVTDIIFPQRSRIPFEEIQDCEFENYIGKAFMVDVECYPNYFLIKLECDEDGKRVVFEQSPVSEINLLKLGWCLYAFKFFSFNGNNYDVPLIFMALKGYDCRTLKEASNRIIDEGWKIREVYEEYRIEPLFIDHVDLIEVCPLDGGLKKYSGRTHAQRMQELPYDPHKELTQEEAIDVKYYCGNDLQNTKHIKKQLEKQIQLREVLSAKYGLDLRSKSDAQIAEAVIAKELEKILGRRPKKPNQMGIVYDEESKLSYKDPGFISFQTLELQQVYSDILAAKFSLDGGGSPMMAPTLGKAVRKNGKWTRELKVKVGQTVYKLGMGGIHSCEKSISFKSDEEYILLDRDVASYYPKIKENQHLFPKHLTEAYLQVYVNLINLRLDAKRNKDKITADALKIVINGAFGKLGSRYSIIYAPDLMLQVTLSGQLCLLMLIEQLELNGIQVVSANTDGIVSKVKRSEKAKFEAIIKQWEQLTNFETEETGYAALYSKDVNNYIALKYKQDDKTKEWLNEIDKCKTKGAYADPWIDHELYIFRFHINPTFQICSEAVCEYLAKGTPIAHTVQACRDITRFVAVRDVKGGAHKNKLYIGKFIRWYISTNETGTINYILSGNKVPDTQNGKPLMDLPSTFPNDIDYNWYIERCNSMLVDIGHTSKEQLKGQGTFF